MKKYRLMDQILANSGERARINSFLVHHRKFSMQCLIDKWLMFNLKVGEQQSKEAYFDFLQEYITGLRLPNKLVLELETLRGWHSTRLSNHVRLSNFCPSLKDSRNFQRKKLVSP
jgi:hypothetical protein